MKWPKGVLTLVQRCEFEDKSGVLCESCLHWHEKTVENSVHCGSCVNYSVWSSCKPYVSLGSKEDSHALRTYIGDAKRNIELDSSLNAIRVNGVLLSEIEKANYFVEQ